MKGWSPEADRNAMYEMLAEPWYIEFCRRKGSHRGQPMPPPETEEQKRWAAEGPVPLDKQDYPMLPPLHVQTFGPLEDYE